MIGGYRDDAGCVGMFPYQPNRIKPILYGILAVDINEGIG
jgi:hypothetical protein